LQNENRALKQDKESLKLRCKTLESEIVGALDENNQNINVINNNYKKLFLFFLLHNFVLQRCGYFACIITKFRILLGILFRHPL
jgi:hypothetical protein